MSNKWTLGAMRVKPFLQKGAQSLEMADALEVKGIYPTWEECVEQGTITAEAGYKFTYGGDLYSCLNSNPAFASNWVPGVGTESLYSMVNEINAGTINDPIPYNGNMELIQGKYYSQDGIVYRCTRSTGQPVYHALSALVGLYVDAVM